VPAFEKTGARCVEKRGLRLRILVFVTAKAKAFRVRPKLEQESLFRTDGLKARSPNPNRQNPDVEKIG
jgi:hypothetical protein